MKTNFIFKHRLQLPVLALALLLTVSGGIGLLNSNAHAAQLAAGTLITNFTHPDLATATDGSSFTFTADIDAAATSCEYNDYDIAAAAQVDSGSISIVSNQISQQLTIHTQHTYNFICYNAAGDYDTVYWTFETPNTDNPTAPTFVSGYPYVASDGSLQASWNASSDSDGISYYTVLWSNYDSSTTCSSNCSSYSSTVSSTSANISYGDYSSWQLTENKIYVRVTAYDKHAPVGSTSSEIVSLDVSRAYLILDVQKPATATYLSSVDVSGTLSHSGDVSRCYSVITNSQSLDSSQYSSIADGTNSAVVSRDEVSITSLSPTDYNVGYSIVVREGYAYFLACYNDLNQYDVYGFYYTSDSLISDDVDGLGAGAITAPSTEAPISSSEFPFAATSLSVILVAGIAAIAKRQLSRR